MVESHLQMTWRGTPVSASLSSPCLQMQGNWRRLVLQGLQVRVYYENCSKCRVFMSLRQGPIYRLCHMFAGQGHAPWQVGEAAARVSGENPVREWATCKPV